MKPISTGKALFIKLRESGVRRGSLWEFFHALENETHELVWTLRGSRNDEMYFDRFGIFLLGDVKWGQPAL